MTGKVIRDPVHGDIFVRRAHLDFIDTWVFQRLRGIKQLGASYLVYPGAVHTRFEHSLGTAWVADRMIASIRRNCGRRAISHDEEIIIATYALIHDITHIPYGHTLEDERRVFKRHDENDVRIDYFLGHREVDSALKSLGVRQEIHELMHHGRSAKGVRPHCYDIVAGTVCADLLDYLTRDAYFTGLQQQYDQRVYQYFCVGPGGLYIDLMKNNLFRPDALTEITNLLRLRYTLSERVYFHHAKIAASAMLSKAVELALSRKRLREADMYSMTDDVFVAALRNSTPAAKRIVDLMQRRQLYKICYLLTRRDEDLPEQFAMYHREPARRAEQERLIAKKAHVPFESVTIYCPSPTMQLKEAKVLFLTQQKGVPDVLRNDPEIELLKAKHRALWRFFVFLDRAHKDERRAVGRACQEVFGVPNEIASYRHPPYRAALGL